MGLEFGPMLGEEATLLVPVNKNPTVAGSSFYRVSWPNTGLPFSRML
jgi:hypothetical protein